MFSCFALCILIKAEVCLYKIKHVVRHLFVTLIMLYAKIEMTNLYNFLKYTTLFIEQKYTICGILNYESMQFKCNNGLSAHKETDLSFSERLLFSIEILNR